MHLLARKPLVFMAAAAAMFIGISPASAATASHSSSPASSHSASSAAAARAAILAAARAASPALAASHSIVLPGVRPQSVYTYYSGNTGGGARHASNIYVYQLSDAAAAADNQVVCVQEHVYPNWPSTSGSFFDQYKCGNGSVSVSLNGANVDQAYCWVNGSTVYISCAEGY